MVQIEQFYKDDTDLYMVTDIKKWWGTDNRTIIFMNIKNAYVDSLWEDDFTTKMTLICDEYQEMLKKSLKIARSVNSSDEKQSVKEVYRIVNEILSCEGGR